MVIGRGVKAFLLAFSTALAGLAAAALILFWQHEAEMRGMMGGMMQGMMMAWIPLTLIALIAVAAAIPIIVYLTYSDRGSTAAVGLTTSEQRVVNYLLERGGEATQKEIAQALNISRLRAHRLVTSLKKRGVVTTTPYGRTNKVRLTADHKTEQP